MAVLLGLSGSTFVRRSVRVQAATQDEVAARTESLQRILDPPPRACTASMSPAVARSSIAPPPHARLPRRGRPARARDARADPPLGRSGKRVAARRTSPIARSYREQRELHIVGEVFWRADGSSFPVEYWSHPMLKHGRVTGAVATFFDISERVNMQARSRQGEIRMAGLVDAVNDGVVSIDADERIVQFNRAAERCSASPRAGAQAPTSNASSPAAAAACGAERRDLRFDYVGPARCASVRQASRRNRVFPLEASLSRLETERGRWSPRSCGTSPSSQNARAEREAREALEASNRAKTELPVQDEPRAADATQCRARLCPADPARHRQAASAGARRATAAHRGRRCPPPRPRQRCAGTSRVESGQMTVTLEALDLRTSVEDAIRWCCPWRRGRT